MDIKDDVSTVTEIAKTAKEVLPQATAQTDSLIALIIEWFRNVPLYPFKVANEKYKHKFELFKSELEAKENKIPPKFLHDPSLAIVGPVFEALKYTIDEDKLREMYVNLLAASIDSRKDSIVHPSYVEIIQKMNSFDANLFKFLAVNHKYIPAINPNVELKGTNKVFVDAMPEWYIKWDDGVDIFQTSASLVRLSKFGVIELLYDRTMSDTNAYDELQSSPVLNKILENFKKNNPNNELELTAMRSVLYVNDYGKQFAAVCIDS